MRDVSMIMRQRQRDVRCEIERRGFHLKAVAGKSGLEYGTLLTYFPGGEREPAVIPMSAVYALADTRALPADLLTLLLPAGLAVVEVPENVDLDEVAAWAEQFSAAKLAAHRKDSEREEQIGPNEHAELSGIVVAFPAKVAAG